MVMNSCSFKVFSHDEESVVTSVEITFLRNTCDRYWEFPKKDDTKIIDTSYLFIGPCTPSETKKNGYRFQEDEGAFEKYKVFKHF